jgi:hypothetical protein
MTPGRCKTIRGENGHILVHTIPAPVADEGEFAQLFLVAVDIEGFEKDLFQANTEWVDETAAILSSPMIGCSPMQGTV